MEFNLNLDPEHGIERFISCISYCIDIKPEEELQWNGFVTFSREHARFYIESEHPDNLFTISDGESLYADIEKEDFLLLVKHLGVKVHADENGVVTTERFTANAFLCALNQIEKLVKLDDIIADLH